MKNPLALFPQWIINQYDLKTCTLNGFVYLEMHQAVWGLSPAEIFAKKLIHKKLLPHGYYICSNTPSLWKLEMQSISFTLVVDNFGVEYVGQGHVDHLFRCIRQHYKLTEGWTGNLYCKKKPD
jgi:hypothetical protein